MALVDGVEKLRTGLDYHLSRHNVLVSNLAQAETPGYKPLDLARTDFEGTLGVAMAATNAGHMGAEAGATKPFEIIEDKTAVAGADGNAVDIDREAVKISTTQMRYDMLAQLASSELSGLEWAANDGKAG
jgi:flagellar basal-body rod protein FlgB